MNRIIKFRAWDAIDKKMYSPIDIFNTLASSWEDNKEGLRCCLILDSMGDRRWLELMQHTGLNDKNGKDIYEGDIVVLGWSTSDVHWKGMKAQVVWWHNGFYFETLTNKSLAQDTYYQFKYCEVIGNIIENKRYEIH